MDGALRGLSISRRLASCNNTTRDKALRLLKTWLPSQREISDDEMKKIWKGLFYCVWHADKQAFQVELINRLASFLVTIDHPLSVQYFEVFLMTIRREWSGIDYLRLDKFYLLIRTFLRHLFILLRKSSWDLELSSRLMGVLEERTLLAVDKLQAQGVTYHISEIFLDELKAFLPIRLEILDVFPDPDPDPKLVSNPAITSDLASATEGTLDAEFQGLSLEEKEKEKESDIENQNQKQDENNKNQNEIENENENENENDDGNQSQNENNQNESGDENGKENVETDSAVSEEKGRRYQYPQRPDAEDCSFYLKTGTCKYGLNCKFNHPIRRKNQAAKEGEKEKEEVPDKGGLQECKFYLTVGGCKFGKACRYHHPRGKTVVCPPADLNFLGLPIRPGERECPFYMRNGSCKYANNCRFNHPDPTAVGGCDSSPGYHNGASVSLHSTGASQPTVASWGSSRVINETVPYLNTSLPYVPVMQTNPEYGYQATMYPPERSLHPPAALLMNNMMNKVDVSTQHQQQMLIEEFPERPGQPECNYFMKTGDCKYRANCKFHHPRNRISRSPVCALSDKGLPLRPDQSICTHYSRYGICKFGPACKFDHPINYGDTASQIFSTPGQL